MKLTVTVEATDAKRILDLAWHTIRSQPVESSVEVKANKQMLEAFRAECESAKGGKL